MGKQLTIIFHMKIRSLALCALSISLLPSVAGATDQTLPDITFNGFGTLGLARSSEDQADFRSSVFQPDGVGYSHEWAPHVDSRLGLQLTANFSERLTAVVQVVAEKHHDHTYKPELEWANLGYSFTPDFSMRVGRIVLPTSMVSDSRKVGYANPWVRPPIAVYSLQALTSSDGVDATYQFRAGEMTGSVQAFYGNRDFGVPDLGTWEAKDIYGAFLTTEFGDATLRGGYQHGNLHSAAINEFFDLFRQFGAEGDTIADNYELSDKHISSWTIGGSYDPGAGFVMGEWYRSSSSSFIGTSTGWYISGGYRIGEFTPYATYGQRDKRRTEESGLDIAALPPPLQPTATTLNGVLARYLRTNDFATLSAGMRWDFRPGFSLKLQFDHVRLGEGSYGDFNNIQPGFELGSNVNVFSTTLDFVF